MKSRYVPVYGFFLRSFEQGKCRLALFSPQVSPYPDPRPSAGYPRPSAGYPRPSAGYPRPSAGYPRPSAGYPRPSPGDPCSSSANSQVLTETLGPLAEVLGEEVAPGSNDVIASDSQNAGKNTWTETGLQWLLLGMLARLAVASTAVSNQSLVLAFAVIKSISLAFASGRQARQEQKNFARLVEVALVMCGVRDTLVRRSFRVGSVVADIWSTFLIFVFGVVVTHVCMVLAFYH